MRGHASASQQARRQDLHGLNANIHMRPPWHNRLCMNGRGTGHGKDQPELPLNVQLSPQLLKLKLTLLNPLNLQRSQPSSPHPMHGRRSHPEDIHSHVEPILQGSSARSIVSIGRVLQKHAAHPYEARPSELKACAEEKLHPSVACTV